MKIRNIGLSTGLTLSAIALVVGLLLISMAESIDFVSGKGGGGLGLLMQWIEYWILYGLGVLIAIAGAISASVALISWFFAKIYSLLSPQDKKMVQWGILILVVFCTGIIAMYSYQQFQQEAMVKLAVEKQTQDETKTVSDSAVIEEHKTISAQDHKCLSLRLL